MQSFDTDWKQYYRRRNSARFSLLAMALALYLLAAHPADAMLSRMHNLSNGLQIAIVLGSVGVAAIAVAAPVLRWFEWPCPACGHKFVHPGASLGSVPTVLYAVGLLIFGGRCAACKLPCGAKYGSARG